MAYMSEEGYNKLLADLKQLETVERRSESTRLNSSHYQQSRMPSSA